MKTAIVSLATVAMIGLTPFTLADTDGTNQVQRLTAFEQKLLGTWSGQTGCAGNFHFRADGTYELTGYGPAPYDIAGTWKVRCDTRPATLALTCKSSEIPEEVGKTTEMKLIQIDAQHLAVQHANQDVVRYVRGNE
jgi:hypothetical protein